VTVIAGVLAMSFSTEDSGWSRIAPTLDVELIHGIPLRISSTVSNERNKPESLDVAQVTESIHALTGLDTTVCDWISLSANEQEWSLCVDRKQFGEVLNRLARASAALYVDRYHRAIDHTAVDWDQSEFHSDFNRALDCCCIPRGTLEQNDYFETYVETMHQESVRLINAGISPFVEAE
jgi:hypothetical protein